MAEEPTDVKRFEIEPFDGDYAFRIVERVDGHFVRYEDYAALRAQLNEAQWTVVREKIRAATAEQAGHTMYAALRSYVQAVKGVLAQRDRVEAEADAWCKEYRWP